MYVQDKSQMLPDEEYKYSNFPELAQVQDEMNTLRAYMETVFTAMSLFEERQEDRIYLNIAELKDMLDMTYRVTDILGRADNVCFDILMNLRTMQEYLHELLYSYRTEGNLYVSDRKVSTYTEEKQDEGMI